MDGDGYEGYNENWPGRQGEKTYSMKAKMIVGMIL
jgi:hypothetical protein